MDRKLIGIRIMQCRKEHGLTQEQLSEKLGISKNHLSSIERGHYVPTIQLIFRICNVMGGTPDYYLIGKITEKTNKTIELIQTMPPTTQRILCRLIESYLEITHDI